MAEDFKHIVRIATTDLEGNKPIYNALQKIKGVSYNFANAICIKGDIDKTKKTGTLTKEEIAKIEDIIKEPIKNHIPSWLLNRRSDYEDNKDKHLVAATLKFQKESDIKRLMKIKSYRGLRHAVGLPVRGQRTRSNFRRNKGKVLGVKRKKKVGKT